MALPPQRVNRQPEGQGAVRRAALELTLEEFNKEMGSKMAASLAQYHARFVEPRLQVIEMVLGIWLVRKIVEVLVPLYYLPDRYPEPAGGLDHIKEGEKVTIPNPDGSQPGTQVLGESKIVHIDRRASSMTLESDARGK